MWRSHRIYLHFLPPRSPELNPAKLLLNPPTQQLKFVPLESELPDDDHVLRRTRTVGKLDVPVISLD